MQLVFKIVIMEINIPVENKVMYITNSYFWIDFNKTRYSIVTSTTEKSLMLSVSFLLKIKILPVQANVFT